MGSSLTILLFLSIILFSILPSLLIFGFRKTRIKSGYLWLFLTVYSLFVLGFILLSWRQIPITIPLVEWEPEIIYSETLFILVDAISWPFAIAIMILALAIFLVDVININEPDLWNWALIPIFSSIVLIAINAGNLLTITLSWVILDITTSSYLIGRESKNILHEPAVISFSIRVISLVFLILGIIQANVVGEHIQFQDFPAETNGFVFIAAGLRLIVIPLSLVSYHKSFMMSSLGPMLYFGPIAASVVVLVRISNGNFPENWRLFFFGVLAITFFLSVLAFIQSSDNHKRKYYWVIGSGVLVLTSTMLGLPIATSVWGLVVFFTGSLLFFQTGSQRNMAAISFLGLVSYSALPFTPTWEGVALFSELPWGIRGVYLLGLAFLIAGYLPFFKESNQIYKEIDHWMVPIKNLGMAILMITLYSLTYFRWVSGSSGISLQTPGWWSGLISFCLALLLLYLKPRRWFSFITTTKHMKTIAKWAYHILASIYKLFSNVLNLLTNILEGDGSILWALLILILFTLTISLMNNGISIEL